ncbi:patatin-like protein [Mycobacterium bourgelatii]|uniref:Putative membrane protein n=1 Tax=Mycobacterium bourgelatii TaxID=1273442 RepID=A0A7I9YWF0_MYCBU|nr:patatin-like protein [Mycobacterium bourgelatii]MCV6978289.1 patatin-like protein [Mycobacterium bourgelatii]GFG93039.1 putative membrane protein [Mycobacterium bourgelatii]
MAFDQAAANPSRPTQSTMELRLATTMTGGVSLAIWMAGVAREINLLAQASQWRRAGERTTQTELSPPAEASLRLYLELLEMLDTIVDVDVLSGTSAGGINAALLASSRVSGADLGGLRDLWLDLGALSDLIRNPRDDYTPSLLYGDERMFKSLAEEIPRLRPGPFPPTVFSEEAHISTTLYVTTTLLDGETSRFTDSFGTLVQDVDRRGVFTFTDSQLTETGTAPVLALALAARSSASFPVAFEPSFVPFTEGTPATDKVPARPPMQPYANTTRAHWVADGGLLDNRPIGVLLRRIFDRRAGRQVRRVLLFVVPSAGPSPDPAEEPPADDIDAPLGLVEALLKNLGALTTQSIAADLRAIRSHQDRMEARTETKLRLAELAANLRNDGRLLTSSLLADYETREATNHAHQLTDALLRQLGTWPPASSALAESIPEHWQDELKIGGDAEKVCRRRVAGSVLSRWSAPGRPLPDSPAEFARYGQPAYDLAKGCAIAVVSAAYQLAQSPAQITELTNLTYGIHAACPPPEPVDLVRLVRNVCTDKAIRQGSIGDAAHQLAETYLEHARVQEESWHKLGGVLSRGYRTLQRLADGLADSAGAQRGSLLQRRHTAAGQLATYLRYLGPEADPSAMAGKLFDLATTQRAMLPAEDDIDQSVELVQVSADTRSLLAPVYETAQQKLTGMQLHHFGAFYKRSWRANDWMWGRLDGAGWLVHVLLDPRRVRWVVEARRDERRQSADGRESGAQWFLRRLKGIAQLDFPSSGQHTVDELLSELAFLDDPKAEMPPSLPKTSMWLAQAWQQHVLDEELDALANTVIDPGEQQRPDWSPQTSQAWAKEVLTATSPDAKYGLLNDNPVAKETLGGDWGSPLMTSTVAKTAATGAGAVRSIRKLPAAARPLVGIVRALALAGYQLVSWARSTVRLTIGAALLLALGVAAALQPATALGVIGVLVAVAGGYLIVRRAWWSSNALLWVLLPSFLVGAGLSLAINHALFGGDAHLPDLRWWIRLAIVGGIVMVMALIGATKPKR